MKKFRYRKYSDYLLLFALAVVLCWLFVLRRGVFGSAVDWISQHSVLPDYFRKQFYATGELFPEFAFHIGGGQNIYNFAYYGLYSPVILLSWLFPFVKMSDYMMAAQFLCLAASVLLLYAWLLGRKFPRGTALGMAVIFLLAGPMIFHSCKQIMFVNYMPFLCMSFLGVDWYFDKRRSGLLVAGIFLMIMTSFYFSIGGMLVLVLYGVHRYFEMCEGGGAKLSFKGFMGEGIRFLIPFITAVLMSGILLVPTALALTGREDSASGVKELWELLIPRLSVERFFYSPYGIGLTTLSVSALVSVMFLGKLSERVLAWVSGAVLVFPVFAWLLNGGLYIRDKVMIPFLPLLCYITACHLRSLEQGESGRNCKGGQSAAERQMRVRQDCGICGRKERVREDCGICGRKERVREDCGICISRERWRRRAAVCLPALAYLTPILMVCKEIGKGEYGEYWKLVLLEGLLTMCLFLFRRRHAVLLLLPSVLSLGLFTGVMNTCENQTVDREFYEAVTDEDAGKLIQKVTGKKEEQGGIYRIEQAGDAAQKAANLNRIHDMSQLTSSIYSSSYNAGYQKFREEVFELEEPFRNFLMQPAADNPVFQDFMGVKYILRRTKPASQEEKQGENSGNTLSGYTLLGTKGAWEMYENEDALPVAFATDRVMTEEAYGKLSFPYNQLALLEYAVAGEGSGDVAAGKDVAGEDTDSEDPDNKKPDRTDMGSEEPSGNKRESEEAADKEPGSKENTVEAVDIKFPETVSSKKDETKMINIPVRETENILFLQFRVKNLRPGHDLTVWVEGTRNKLTSNRHFYYNKNTVFTYAVPLEKGQKQIRIKFGEGHYEISGVKCFLGAPVSREEAGLCQSEFMTDQEKTKGNVIAGEINVKSDGYFVTTIPYDESFDVYVDGQETGKEKVNTTFLGFQISEGEHEIRIVYHAPGMLFGKLLSLAGVVLMFVNWGRGIFKNTPSPWSMGLVMSSVKITISGDSFGTRDYSRGGGIAGYNSGTVANNIVEACELVGPWVRKGGVIGYNDGAYTNNSYNGTLNQTGNQ